MKFYRKLTALVLVMLTALVLNACGGDTAAPTATPAAGNSGNTTASNSAPTATPASAPAATATTVSVTSGSAATEVPPTPTYPMGDSNPSAATTIKLWIMPNSGNSKDDMIKLLAGFKTAMPNVNVQVTVLDWGSAFTKITNAVTSGEGPDVTQLGTTWVGAVSALDGLRPYTADEIASMGGKDSFFPAAWNTSHLYGSTDTTAIPWFLDVRGLYYRTDILKNLNIDPATGLDTWEHFDATMAKVTAAKVVTTTFVFPGKNDWNVVHNFAPWVWSAGGDMLNSDNSKSTFNSDQALVGVKQYTSFVGKGYTPVSVLEKNTADAENIFKSGNAAFVVAGSWIIGQGHQTAKDGGFSDMAAAGKVGVVAIPAGPAGSITFVGGSDLAVMKASKHPTEAVALVKYLTGQEANVAYAKLTGNMPASKAGYGDQYFSGDPMYQVFIKAAGTGKSYPTIAAWGQIEDAMKKNLSGLWDDVAGVNGTFSPDMIKLRLDAAAKEVDAIIAANK